MSKALAVLLSTSTRVSEFLNTLKSADTKQEGYSRAGVKFSYKVNSFNANAVVPTHYRISVNFTLKETIAEIERLLNQENVIAERGNIIVNVSEREILRSRGEYSG
jgi:hypothetical protein